VDDRPVGDLEGTTRAILKIRSERAEAEKELSNALSKVARLRRQEALLEARQKRTFEEGLRNVEELEALGVSESVDELELPVDSEWLSSLVLDFDAEGHVVGEVGS
jgi:hypothetical protein